MLSLCTILLSLHIILSMVLITWGVCFLLDRDTVIGLILISLGIIVTPVFLLTCLLIVKLGVI